MPMPPPLLSVQFGGYWGYFIRKWNYPQNLSRNLIRIKEDRNAEIYQRFLAGERVVDLLANEYRVSLQ